MPANPSSRPVRAFVLRAADIRKMARLLSERIGNLTILAASVDGVEWEFHDADELCKIPNPWPERVVGLRLSARSDTCDARADVRFCEGRDAPVRVDVEGSGEAVEGLRRELAPLVRGLQPRDRWLARADFIGAGFLSCIASVILSRVLLASGVVDPKAMAWDVDRLYFEAAAVAILFAIMALAFLLTRFRDALFPAGVIALGQMRKRNRVRAMQRWMLVGLFAMLPAALVVMMLWA